VPGAAVGVGVPGLDGAAVVVGRLVDGAEDGAIAYFVHPLNSDKISQPMIRVKRSCLFIVIISRI
jgi:hypothetical protein